jgi:hypothetical protein
LALEISLVDIRLLSPKGVHGYQHVCHEGAWALVVQLGPFVEVVENTRLVNVVKGRPVVHDFRIGDIEFEVRLLARLQGSFLSLRVTVS